LNREEASVSKDWWELQLDGEGHLRIQGEQNARWFYAHILETDARGEWRLVPLNGGMRGRPQPLSAAAVVMRQENLYCVGSD